MEAASGGCVHGAASSPGPGKRNRPSRSCYPPMDSGRFFPEPSGSWMSPSRAVFENKSCESRARLPGVPCGPLSPSVVICRDLPRPAVMPVPT